MVTVRFMRVSNLEEMQYAKNCASKSETSDSKICHYISLRSMKEMKDTLGFNNGNYLSDMSLRQNVILQ
jgi:hypothetical protein